MPRLKRERRGNAIETINAIHKLFSNKADIIKFYIPKSEEEELNLWSSDALQAKTSCELYVVLNQLIINNSLEAMKFMSYFRSLVFESMPFNLIVKLTDGTIILEPYSTRNYYQYCYGIGPNIIVQTSKDKKTNCAFLMNFYMTQDKVNGFFYKSKIFITGY